jgi:hypothetical protein
VLPRPLYRCELAIADRPESQVIDPSSFDDGFISHQ